ncbi:MAG: hypothetical protein K0Q95_3076 [Bacteroidota bacterium]|jgi:uncharacterized membrane protein YfcA|nr:hypothetical protein [Bacteroidota bacterium]
MNFLKKRTSWSNFDLGIIKICVGSIGVSIGAYFHRYLENNLAIFIGIYVISGFYLFRKWTQQLKNKGDKY